MADHDKIVIRGAKENNLMFLWRFRETDLLS